MRYINVLLLALVFLMSGCSSTSQGVGGDYRLDTNGGKGLAVLSTRMDDRCGMGMVAFNLNYKSESKGVDGGYFLIKNMFVGYDFENPGGYFYTREIPAGDYKFYQVSAAAPGWTGGYLKSPVKFHVAKGKAQYLGEITVTLECKEQGKIIPGIAISDKRKRDAKLFDERMKNMSSKDLTYSIMKLK